MQIRPTHLDAPLPGGTITPMPYTVPDHIRRRILATLFTGQGLISASQIVTFGVLPIAAVELAGTEAAAGVPATAILIGRAIAAYPVGWLMDRVGRRLGLSIGFFLCATGAVVAGFGLGWASLAGFLLGTLVSGMGRGVSDQARFAAAEVEPAERRGKAVGLVVFAGTIGAIAGPLLLGPSAEFGVRLGVDAGVGPMLVSAALAYVALLVNFLFLRPDPMRIAQAIEATEPLVGGAALPEAGRPLRQILADWSVRLAIASLFVGQLVMTSIMVITPLHMAHSEYDAGAISWVLMAHTLGMFGLSSVTGWLNDRLGSVIMIVVGALVLALSGVIAPLAPNVPVLAVALFLLGLGWNFCFVAGSTLLADSLQQGERGSVQGASETLVSLAAGIGSLGTGLVFARGGMVSICAVGIAFALALIAFQVWVTRIQPRAMHPGEYPSDSDAAPYSS